MDGGPEPRFRSAVARPRVGSRRGFPRRGVGPFTSVHICVIDRNGVVARETKAVSSSAAIAAALAAAPSCTRVVFETGRMAPMLYHGLVERGVPVVCIESRQAYQALKTLATHKTDRHDARGLAQLARTGF